MLPCSFADMSRAMLDKLEQRGIYRQVFCSAVGGGHRIEAIPDKHYDIVVVGGGYVRGHMPVDSLREICRVIKPGISPSPIVSHANV